MCCISGDYCKQRTNCFTVKKIFPILLLTILLVSGIHIKAVVGQTYCNPLNLNYRYNMDQPSGRDVSDPNIVLYKDTYYLFASKARGYWYSNDLLSWKSVTTETIPLKDNTPTAVVIGDWLYFFSSLSNTIYRSNDPSNGKWEVYNNSFALSMIVDPVLFADTDGRVYCYYGCTNDNRLMARELDPNDKLNPIGVPIVCLRKNTFDNSLKRAGENNSKSNNISIVGSWINKYNGKYYFQCSEPDPEFKSYKDVVYISDKPLGPYTYAANNPFSAKRGGFVCGASHGSTFIDKFGNWWHIATITASFKQNPESRLGLFPAGFDDEGNLYANTDFGDYPIILPNFKYTDLGELNPGWSLLSYNKAAKSSSTLSSTAVAYAFDENFGTYWSAQSGKKGEWLSVDLESDCNINALQVNFAEDKSQFVENEGVSAHQYLIEYSVDKQNWKILIDKTANTEDRPHCYEALDIPVQARYVKITNYHVPYGTFAISGFRIFGTGTGPKPEKVNSFFAVRDFRDPGSIKLSWVKKGNAIGYNIRYGSQKEKLYHNYQVFSNAPVTIKIPDKSKPYWFEIDAFGENGVTPSDPHQSH